MSYRDDLDALKTRIDLLEQERDHLEARRRELADTERRCVEVEAELEDLKGRVKRRQLPLLDGARIASPCPASWDEMVGDDRKRFCGQCNKHVYNVAAMPGIEAEAMVREALAGGGDGPCVRLYRRRDGTVLTADCPVGRRRKRRRRAAGAVVLSGLGYAAAASLLTPTLGNIDARHGQVEPQEEEASEDLDQDYTVTMGALPVMSTTAPEEQAPPVADPPADETSRSDPELR